MKKTINYLFLALAITLLASCNTAKILNVNDVENFILKNRNKRSFTELAKNISNYSAREIDVNITPLKAFYFTDDNLGYSFISHKGYIVLICCGFGNNGGYATYFIKVKTSCGIYFYYLYNDQDKVLFGKYKLGASKASYPIPFSKLPISLRTTWKQYNALNSR